MKRFLVRDGDREPLPPIDLADDVVIGASPSARVRLPVLAQENVRVSGDRWTALAEVIVDGARHVAGESGPIGAGVELRLGTYRVRVMPAPDGAPATPPQRTESLARELVRSLLGATATPSFAVVRGPNPGSKRDLPPPEARVVIGRGDEADWVILDEDVSRTHVEVVRGWDGVTVRDLGSKNGTKVNGIALAEVVTLHDGDAIGLGDVELAFHDPAEQHLRAERRSAAPAPAPVDEPDGKGPSPWPYVIAATVAGIAIVGLAWVLAT